MNRGKEIFFKVQELAEKVGGRFYTSKRGVPCISLWSHPFMRGSIGITYFGKSDVYRVFENNSEKKTDFKTQDEVVNYIKTICQTS